MIDIKDRNENIRFSTEINEGCLHKKKLMSEDYIVLNFTVSQPIEFERGDYIIWKGVRYEVSDFNYPTFNSGTGGYAYQLRLDAYYWKWKNKHLFYNRQGNREASWHLTRTPDAHLSIVCSNLTSLGYFYNGNEFTYAIDESVNMSAKNISYSNTNIIDALTLIAQAWEAEWWVEDNIIHLGRCEYNTVFNFEFEKNVKSMSRSESKDNFATRIYAFGSNRNLPVNYRKDSGVVVEGVVQSRLMLPADTPYVDAYPNMSQEDAVEAVVVFEDVYPRRVGKMTGVDTIQKTIIVEKEDGGKTEEKWNAYRFKDNGLNFISKYVIPGKELRIVFSSGVLNGMDFAVIFNPDKNDEASPEAQLWEIVRNEDYGVSLPNDGLKPESNDTYILYGFDTSLVSEVYVPAAEQELKERALAYVEKSKEDPSVYECIMNVVDMVEQHINLNIGDRVKLFNPAYIDVNGRQSRIYGFEKHLDGSQINYTVGNTARYSRLAQVENEIKEIVYQGNAYSGNGSGVYVISRNDNTLPSDRNVFSSLKTVSEIENRSISRLKDDVAAGHITFEDGILVRSSLSTPEARSVISTALEEEGDVTLLSASLIEESQTPEILSTALTEQTMSGRYDEMSMDDLTNVDGFNSLDNGKYAFEMRNGILYPVAAGDFSQANVMKLTFVSSGVMTVAYGSAAVIAFNFTSTIDDMPTGNGNVVIRVGNKAVYGASIVQGDNSFDVSSYLTVGDNTVIVEVTDTYGTARKLTYSVNAVSLSIESTFDATLPITTPTFTYRYTPMGAVAKTIHFVIDGKEEATFITSASNRQLIQTLPRGRHGNHLFEVYLTAVVDGNTIRSNSLFYDLISVEDGKTTPIITSAYQQKTMVQYNTVMIPYVVYDPSSSETEVTLQVNGQTVSTLRVNRTSQSWNYRMDAIGHVKLEIVCRSVRKVFQIEVTPSSIDVEAETTALELFLSSMGRSNSETNRDKWVFNNISSELSGFNWSTNGWIPDANGNIALKLSGDARVIIPVQPFAKDIRLAGKTIEIEFSTHDVVDYEAVIASCLHADKGFRITAQSAFLGGDITKVETKFKEEERVRISFVIEETAENRLIYTYINGINSGTKQYVDNESFLQTIPQNIVLGSNKSTLNLYNIRVYDNNLNQYQVLDNYIADMDDVNKKIELYVRNQVYNDYGLLTYDKICNQIPCMTIVGELPAYKGDKKTVLVEYENRQEPEFSFVADGCQIDVQGTSSQYYPRKNFKTNFKKGFKMTESGELVDKYKLTVDMIGASVFCEKADFAESSGTHNTGVANIVDEILKDVNLLTPPQTTDINVRTTVCGFPIVIFHKTTEDSEPEFVGKYNFNTDKAAEETFGFTNAYPNCQCWEFKNNTSARMLFRESEYVRKDSNGNPDWLNDFEARYPDDDTLNAEYENGKIPTDLKRLTDWVVSCIGNVDKFKSECTRYFDINNLVFYYMLTELFGMVDQRAKNQFLTSWNGNIWYFLFYDNDTVFGVNNEGENVFSYNIETHDVIGTQNVFNGADSELWILVEQAYASEIEAMYFNIRQQGVISYEKVIEYLNTNQSDKWNESIYNEDGKFKYIDPLVDGYYDYGQEGWVYTGEYLYALQGSRAEHRKWWLFNRFRYIDSKYNAGNYFGDTATLRLYTPSDWSGIEPDANFRLIPYNDQYLRIKFGSYVSAPIRGEKDKEFIVPAPENTQFNDTETIIYGASRLKSVGDLSAKYPGTVDMSSAAKLEELIIGSSVTGYKNTNLRNVTVKSNPLLKTINIENCPGYTSALDLSGCESIEQIYAKGSGISAVVLPPGGFVSRMELPTTIANLTIRNQTKLTDQNLIIESYDNISAIWIENTTLNIGWDIIKSTISKRLERVRLINIDYGDDNIDRLYNLIKLQGLDEVGNTTPNAVITGKFFAATVTDTKLKECQDAFPELDITYGVLNPATITTFVFQSNKGKPITNAIFTCNFEYKKVNEYTYSIEAEDNSKVNLSFSADNHDKIERSYEVLGTRTQSYQIVYQGLRTIYIRSNTSSTRLQGRIVLDTGEIYNTDADGYIYIRGNKAISGKAYANGYSTYSFNWGVIDNDITQYATVYSPVSVTFKITGSLLNELIEGATIDIEGVGKYASNRYGEIQLTLGYGDYNYDVYYGIDGEHTTGVLNVRTSAVTRNLSVKMSVDYYRPKEDGNIQFSHFIRTDSYLSLDVNVTSNSDNYIIYWGDGSNTVGLSSQENYNHVYESIGLYHISISNSDDVTYALPVYPNSNNDRGLIGYWSIGNSKILNLSLSGSSLLIAIGDVFKNDNNRNSFSSCFYNCGRLTAIPVGLFDNCPNVTIFSGCFYNCNSLTAIPAGLFDNCPKVYDFRSCFQSCTSLTDIPADLFDNCPNVIGFSQCFQSCRLTAIPVGLFDNCPNVTNFSSCFVLCTSLRSIPTGLFDNCPKVTDFRSCFNYCTSLTDIPAGLFDNCPNVIGFSQCFQSCSSLTNIPADLFDNCPNVTNITQCFSYCSSLIYVYLPITIKSLGGGTYEGCTSLTFIISETDIPPAIVNNTFTNTNNCPIYVPDSAVETYKSATNWNTYADRILPVSQKPAS